MVQTTKPERSGMDQLRATGGQDKPARQPDARGQSQAKAWHGHRAVRARARAAGRFAAPMQTRGLTLDRLRASERALAAAPNRTGRTRMNGTLIN